MTHLALIFQVVLPALGGVAGLAALLKVVFDWLSRRQQAEDDRQDRLYERLDAENKRMGQECQRCRTELVEAEKRHIREMADAEKRHMQEIMDREKLHQIDITQVRDDLADVKDALVKRIDVVDEMLSSQQEHRPLSEERLAILRAENKALRSAIIKSRL